MKTALGMDLRSWGDFVAEQGIARRGLGEYYEIKHGVSSSELCAAELLHDLVDTGAVVLPDSLVPDDLYFYRRAARIGNYQPACWREQLYVGLASAFPLDGGGELIVSYPARYCGHGVTLGSGELLTMVIALCRALLRLLCGMGAAASALAVDNALTSSLSQTH